MDGGAFDRLTRLLAGRVMRRGGAAAAIAGLAELAGREAFRTTRTFDDQRRFWHESRAKRDGDESVHD